MDENNQLAVYQDHAERHEKAWLAFTRIYILERPKPDKPKWWDGLPWMMLPFSVIAAAGILLSALRTAPVFQSVAQAFVGESIAQIEALLAIVVIEVFVVMGRYAYVLQEAQDGDIDLREVKKWTKRGFWTAFAIAVCANLYASVSHLPFLAEAKPVIDVVVAVAVGISAPLLAFISADILATLWTRSEKRRADLKAAFEAAMENWRDARDRSWNARKADYGLKIRVENAPSVHSPVQRMNSLNEMNEQIQREYSANSSTGYSKRMDARSVISEFFEQHPDKLNSRLDELVGEIEQTTGVKVGRTSIHNIRKAMLQEAQ